MADLKGVYQWVKNYVAEALDSLPPGGSDGNGIYSGSGTIPDDTVASGALTDFNGGIYFGEALSDVSTVFSELPIATGIALHGRNSAPGCANLIVNGEQVSLGAAYPTDEASAKMVVTPNGADVVAESSGSSGTFTLGSASSSLTMANGPSGDPGSGFTITQNSVSLNIFASGKSDLIEMSEDGIRLSFNKAGNGADIKFLDINSDKYLRFFSEDSLMKITASGGSNLFYADDVVVADSPKSIPDIAYIQSLTGRYADASAAIAGGVVVGELWFNTTTSKYMVRLV